MIHRNHLAAAIACLALQAAMPAAAADDSSFTLTPYYWAVGIDGKLEDNNGPGSIDFNQDFGDVSDNLDFNGSLMLEANVGHWASFAAVDYMKTENDDIDLKNIPGAGANLEVETDTTMVTAATGYRFTLSERSTVDLMVGVRYAKLDVEASLGGAGSVNGDTDVTDGIVILRPRLALGEHWEFSPTMSVGGGDSDLVWEMAPELVWKNACDNFQIRFGYRSVNYEFEEDNVDTEISFAGPMVGLGFKF